jgi:hypothetical protein
MAFNAAGTYIQVSGAVTAAAGQILQSAVWNTIHTDLGNSLTALGTVLDVPVFPRNVLAANGGFEVWQRGAGGAASISVGAGTTAYTADRWYLITGANQASVVSQQAGLAAGSGSCAQIQRTAGQTGVTAMTFAYPLDTDEVVRLRGRTVSLKFAAASGALFSPASGTITATLYAGTGTIQKAGAAAVNFTSASIILSGNANLTAGGASYGVIAAGTVPATATQAELQFTWTPVGTAGATDYFQLDNVMLDISGAPAQGFLSNYEIMPFDMMLNMCKRHFWKSFSYGTAPAQNAGSPTGELIGLAGKAGATTQMITWRNPVSMRAVPGTITFYNPSSANGQARDETAAADCSGLGLAGYTTESGVATLTGAAGTAVGNILGVHITVDAGI